MLRLIQPKFFMPIHGEYRMLKIHTELAQECGVEADNCFIMDNGDVLALTADTARVAGHFPAADVYIDGNGIGDIGNAVIRDRRLLSEEGLVVVVATINMQKQAVMAGPDILSRGFIYMRESGELINQAQRRVYRTIKNLFKGDEKVTEAMLKEAIIDNLQEFLFDKTERRPVIMPMLVLI